MVKKASKKVMTPPRKTTPRNDSIRCSLCDLRFKTKKAFVAHRRIDKDGNLACYSARQLGNRGWTRDLDGIWR